MSPLKPALSSKAFIFLVLLIGYCRLAEHKDHFQVIDMFAGQARLAKLGHGLGLNVAAMDRMYDKIGDNKKTSNCMDLGTDGGFARLVFTCLRAGCNSEWYCTVGIRFVC